MNYIVYICIMGISSRIALIIKNQSLTNSAFADILGVQRSNISHILSGRSKPGLEFLQKVLEKFPRVNAEWLIMGATSQNSTGEAQKVLFSDVSEDKPIATTTSQAHEETKALKELDYLLLVYKDGTFERIVEHSSNA
jgi:transcriptional regulator with XRE-family HTH domain